MRFSSLVCGLAVAPRCDEPRLVPKLRGDTVRVRCPYCHERVELFVDPETLGSYVEDCAVCCRPWSVHVLTDDEGERFVEIGPAQ